METERVQLLNCRIDNITMQELLERFDRGLLVTPNVDHLMTLQRDREFYDIYGRADYVVADGQIVVFALRRLLRTPVKERVSGSDFFPLFCEYHRDREDVRIFLLGGPPGAAEKARAKLNRRVGREIVVATAAPGLGFESRADECNEIVARIVASGATVLAVGVGAPKQEKWIAAHRDRLPGVRMFMGIGATIEFQAGTMRRSPPWVSDIGLEWLHRLLQDPRRLWKRYLLRDTPFFGLVLRQALGRYRDPFNTHCDRQSR